MASVYPCKHLFRLIMFKPLKHFGHRYWIAAYNKYFTVVAKALNPYNFFGLYHAYAPVKWYLNKVHSFIF